MIPKKLKRGDEIRVISPALSLSIISKKIRELATKRLNELGFKLTFSTNSEEIDEFNSSSIKSRINDLHEAFSDNNVKGILTAIGGSNSNQILRYIDYEIIKSNPKVLCGYSDITALQNAIYTKTKLVTYSGPFFSTLGMAKGLDYTLGYFKKCVTSSRAFDVKPSRLWSDDSWYIDQERRKFIKSKGYLAINTGNAEGKIIGGNLCTFNLLQGTEYMPKLKDSILFIEDDDVTRAQVFDRDLQSLIHQPGFDGVKGILIGRFQKESKISDRTLTKIIKTKKELDTIPVLANIDFGHTTPHITYPIGGIAKLSAENRGIKLTIIKH